MPVDKAQIEAYLNELGLSDTVKTSVLGELTTNDRAATQFVGQRLRHDDYTRKQQEAAERVQQLEAHANGEIQKYATQLFDAQNRINSIMGDFEKETISRATAEARLQKVKTTYNLSDEDIPTVTTPAAAAAAPQPQIDFQKELANMRTQLMTEFRSDMMSLPRLAVLQNDIADRHNKLVGKPLTREDFNSLLDQAEKERRPLETVWQEKYKISDLQNKQMVDDAVKNARIKWEDEQKKNASDAALASVSSAASTPQFTQSTVLQRKYERRDESGSGLASPSQQAPAAAPAASTQTSAPPAAPAVKMTGADRAAALFIERRSNGVPLGAAPVPKS
ncbi:MAG TPA: hypothetical protein VF077_07620 [Nitrospiraceae bacterium]